MTVSCHLPQLSDLCHVAVPPPLQRLLDHFSERLPQLREIDPHHHVPWMGRVWLFDMVVQLGEFATELSLEVLDQRRLAAAGLARY
eukprot:SAG11_NODE_7384_length_1152_cov_1.270655_2_plen_86_part_00